MTNDCPFDTDLIMEEAYQFCNDKIGQVMDRIFHVHKPNVPLLSKKERGHREHLIQTELTRLLQQEFQPSTTLANTSSDPDNEQHRQQWTKRISPILYQKLYKTKMAQSAIQHRTRADGRLSCDSVRPITAIAPILPDATVHGSALFARGETRVLCTATLGAPKDGIPTSNHYMVSRGAGAGASSRQWKKKQQRRDKNGMNDLPVGSLRYTRNHAAMESDLNDAGVRASKELAGDSGTMEQVKQAFLHYDFPSYSTGECNTQSSSSSPNRRAIGHGNLAERAILPILPPSHTFPYAIRLTSEVTGSNGSSSMASVCGATLALLDAGVPISQPVAGISVGLVTQVQKEEKYALLLDITGTEDHYGEMDLKIAGTRNSITALQLDCKSLNGIPHSVLIEAMELAKTGRNSVLNAMNQQATPRTSSSSDPPPPAAAAAIPDFLPPRPTLKACTPRVEIVRFPPQRKRDLVGPGGAVLRQMQSRYDVQLDLSQDGTCLLSGRSADLVSQAKTAIMDLVSDVEEGVVYDGIVVEVKDFGCIVELLRNKEGILHISEYSRIGMDQKREELRVGHKVKVLCTEVNAMEGSIKLSRRRMEGISGNGGDDWKWRGNKGGGVIIE